MSTSERGRAPTGKADVSGWSGFLQLYLLNSML